MPSRGDPMYETKRMSIEETPASIRAQTNCRVGCSGAILEPASNRSAFACAVVQAELGSAPQRIVGIARPFVLAQVAQFGFVQARRHLRPEPGRVVEHALHQRAIAV